MKSNNLLKPFEDGQKHDIDQKTYEDFFRAMAPALFRFEFAGESWDIGLAESEDYVFALKKTDDGCFVRKTDILNPHLYGPPDQQPHRLPPDSSKKWLGDWLRIGRRNGWIKEANDPPFTLDSFHECSGVDELIAKFRNGNWTLGQAFTLGDLCFIQQDDGGDEWLAIRQKEAFDSISFGWIIKDDGEAEARKLIDRLRSAPVPKCRALEY